MPTIDLTSENIRNPWPPYLIYLESIMCFPNDPAARLEYAQSAGAHFAANYGPAGQVMTRESMQYMAAAKPLPDLQEKTKPIFVNGVLVGYTICEMIAPRPGTGPAASLREAKQRALARFPERGLWGTGNSIKTFDNTAWAELAPVAHLWAAYVTRTYHSGDSTFPCRLADLGAFITKAEMMLIEASRLRLRNGKPLLDRTIAWTWRPAAPC